ncbi:unnamed protein product [Echinostoma caproni]|uniref:N-terminal Ras-GEF domain-containing protein n=1 Tax=Echinostoma caproni TaxID=27848 RepID=A0A3P8ID88_9TREM|nr:unnamed protein product [Echinostoma caproni]
MIEHLIADLSNLDITYPEDFLLTYRTFLDSPRPIVDRLLSWHLHSPKLRARVNRIILLWVHNHFNDFEDSVEMMRFVEKFDEILAKDGTAWRLDEFISDQVSPGCLYSQHLMAKFQP